MHGRLSLFFPLLLACAADINAPPKPAAFVVAVFDPKASPAPLIPLPNDLAKTGGDGVHLNVPDSPIDSPAQMDFNHYLNTLDGFPSSTPGSFAFSAAVDPASVSAGSPVTNGSVLIFDATIGAPFQTSDFAVAVAADNQSASITPTKRWAEGHQFAVVIFGGTDATGVKGAGGEQVLASPAFFFLRSPVPLLGLCTDGTTPGCVCPAAVVAKGDPNDKTCHSVITGLADDLARQLEGPRQQLSAALDVILLAAGTDGGMPRNRNNVVLMWTFSIASAPMAVFDPTRGDVPFPNDALINQMTGLVNVPFAPTDPQAAIKMGLNTLDGFSTTAPETLDLDAAADIDATTVVPGKSAILLGVSDTINNANPPFTAAPVTVNGGTQQIGTLAIQPTGALEPDQLRYAVIVTGDVKDAMGRSLVAPPTIVLTRGVNPLVDGQGHTLVPSALDDASAQQLEVLRQALAPLYMVAETGLMVPRTKIAALWTFTTESVQRPLNALNELPKKSAFATDVTVTHTALAAEITAKAAMLPFASSHLGAIVLGSFSTKRAADPATGLIAFDRNAPDSTGRFTAKLPANPITEPVRFAMTLPAGAGPFPIAIAQHGLGDWRGAMTTVADSFAAAGWGTIMFDMAFHGARSACTADNQCVGGAAGSCDTTTGVCSSGLAFDAPSSDDPTACALQPISGDATDCRPVASGKAFVNPANLFASRDNLRQYVVDAAQVIRVLSDSANPNGLAAALVPSSLSFDAGKLGFIGQSLGGVEGTVFLSVAPQPTIGVLNVTGGHLVGIIADGNLSGLLTPLLTALNVQPDTAGFFQLANTATWILDPVDPLAVGQFIARSPVTSYLTGFANAKKNVIVQEAGMDATILPQFEEALSAEIFGPAGLDENGHAQGHTTSGTAVSTFFAGAQHGSLLSNVPSPAIMQAEQAQAVGFISSSGASLPSP